MNEESTLDSAIKVLDQIRRSDLYQFRTGFVFLLFGVVIIFSELYFLSKAENARRVSAEVSALYLAEEPGQKKLIEAIDQKFLLLRAEINLSDGYMGIFGIIIFALGLHAVISYRQKERINSTLETLLKQLDAKNS